jgi:hypothetical protein
VHSPEFPYRMVKGGFYMGNGPDIAFYPMPSHADLRRDHNVWWRSANPRSLRGWRPPPPTLVCQSLGTGPLPCGSEG